MLKNLKNSLDWVPEVKTAEPVEKEPAPPQLEAEPIPSDVKISIRDEPSKVADVIKLQAEAFAAEIRAGKGVQDAAASVHSTPERLLRDPAVATQIFETLRNWKMTAELRRELVRARTMHILMTGKDADAIGAARVIAADPDVGLGAGAPLVQVNLGDDVKTVLATVEPLEDEKED